MKVLVFFLIVFSFLPSYAESFENAEKKQILQYLESLSVEELKELHELRKDVHAELGEWVALSAIFGLFTMVGAVYVFNDEFFEKTKQKHPSFYKIYRRVFIGLTSYVVAATVAGWVILINQEGLGISGASEDVLKIGVREYVESLDLEELRKLHKDLEELTEEHERSFPQEEVPLKAS